MRKSSGSHKRPAPVVAVAVDGGPLVTVGDGGVVAVGVALGVGVGDAVGVGLGDGVKVAVGVGVGDAVGVSLGVGVWLGVGVRDGVGVSLGVGVMLGVSVGDGVGVLDEGEPMLEGIQFDILELVDGDDPWVHQRRTDADGLIRIGFRGPARLKVRELLRQSGGQWGITTEARQEGGMWYMTSLGQTVWGGSCADSHVWVGNARTFLPETGGGGASYTLAP